VKKAYGGNIKLEIILEKFMSGSELEFVLLRRKGVETEWLVVSPDFNL